MSRDTTALLTNLLDHERRSVERQRRNWIQQIEASREGEARRMHLRARLECLRAEEQAITAEIHQADRLFEQRPQAERRLRETASPAARAFVQWLRDEFARLGALRPASFADQKRLVKVAEILNRRTDEFLLCVTDSETDRTIAALRAEIDNEQPELGGAA